LDKVLYNSKTKFRVSINHPTNTEIFGLKDILRQQKILIPKIKSPIIKKQTKQKQIPCPKTDLRVNTISSGFFPSITMA